METLYFGKYDTKSGLLIKNVLIYLSHKLSIFIYMYTYVLRVIMDNII